MSRRVTLNCVGLYVTSSFHQCFWALKIGLKRREVILFKEENALCDGTSRPSNYEEFNHLVKDEFYRILNSAI